MAQQRTADIVIVGAGFVGQAVALTFARAHPALGLDIVLVDGRPPGNPASVSGDARSFALTATSCNMLKALGLWPRLESHAEPMRDIKVTDSRPGAAARPSLLHFSGELDPAGPSAHMIENHVLVTALDEAVAEEPSISRLAGQAAGATERTGAMAKVSFEDGSVAAASLLVAADGRASPMRAAAGIETVGWSYGQHGIVVTVAHERPHHGCAEEHFMPAGPFAILPLTGNRSSLVWTEESAVAKALVAGSDAAFQTALETRFGDHLGEVTPCRAAPGVSAGGADRARLCGRAAGAGWRCGPCGASDRRPRFQSWPARCRGAGRSGGAGNPSRPRLRISGRAR